MLTGMELMSCPNLAVPAEVMHHIVHVESSANPFAIGVVGGQLRRQPQNLAEALATVNMLDAKGYNYSLGIAQVNRANFDKYGLDSYEKAFDTCANLSAGAHILADCYARAKGDWGNAFSCYYSGNFKTGYRDGYVQKVYASIDGDATAAGNAPRAIPLIPGTAGIKPGGESHAPTPRALKANYLVALRSVAIDTAASAIVNRAAASTSRSPPIPARPDAPARAEAEIEPGKHGPSQALADAAQTIPGVARAEPAVFTPKVRGPNDAASPESPVGSMPRSTDPDPRAYTADRAGLHPDQHDAAFVF